MGGLKRNGWGLSGLVRFEPSSRAEAPSLTWLEPGKTELRSRSGQVIALGFREIQKLLRELGADRVHSGVARTGLAGAVSKKTGDRVATALLELGA